MTTTEIIIDQIDRMGWIVKTLRVNGLVEMHAVKRDGSAEPQVARCNDGDGPDETLRCARLLAEACGAKLKDG